MNSGKSKSAFGAVLLGVFGMVTGGLTTGCLDLIGYRDHVVGDPNGQGGAGGAGGTGGTGATTASAGGGGSGGMCEPGSMVSCYSGPPGTEKEGICKTGLQSCDTEGIPSGACIGEQTPLPETCATTTDDDCDGSDCAIWSQLFADQSHIYFDELAVDAGGNIVALGRLQGAFKFGPIDLQSGQFGSLVLAKMDPMGGLLWATTIGDSATTEVGARIAVDPLGNVVLAGNFTGSITFGETVLTAMPGGSDIDAFVAKLDPLGDPIWAKSYPGAGSVGVSGVTCSKFGDIAVVGNFDGGFDFGGNQLDSGGFRDVFVAKISSSGIVAWAKRFGDADNQYSGPIAFDAASDVVVAGFYEGVLNFGGSDLVSDPPDEFADIYLAKLKSSDGSHGWSKSFVADPIGVLDVAVTQDASVILGGQFVGGLELGGNPLFAAESSEIFLAKFDSFGDHLWSKSVGGVGNDGIQSISVGDDNTILVAGDILQGAPQGSETSFGGSPLNVPGLLLAKFDADGSHIWSRAYGKACYQAAFSSTKEGEIVGCQLTGSVDFGNGTLATERFATMKYYSGIVVAKLAP